MILSELEYPTQEVQLQTELNDMFGQLKLQFDKCDLRNGKTYKDLVLDGFFPHYTEQKCKILFVGRESVGITGTNYIDLILSCIKENNIGSKTVNQHRFFSLMLYLAFALNKDRPKWKDIPMASEIAKDFATENGVSFAFMNYSKLSNESGSWQADWSLIDSYADVVKGTLINFYEHQIDVVQPDIILTMNLEGRLKEFGELESLEYGKVASYYRLKTKSKLYLLSDMYHFSAVKNMEKCFYLPLLEGIDRFGLEP